MQGEHGRKEHSVNVPALLGYCLSHGFSVGYMLCEGWRGDGKGAEFTIVGGRDGPRGGCAGVVATVGT
jgi:hypothetical protein